MSSKRTLTTLNENATLAQVVKWVLYLRLDFASGVKRYHTEIGPETVTHPVYGAETYTGIGDFGGLVSDITESVDGNPERLQLGLTGVKSSLITDVLTDDYVDREIELMIEWRDTDDEAVDDPTILFSGYMDNVDIVLGPQLGMMTLSAESRGSLFLSASDLRFTDEDKQAESSGDLFSEYLYRMSDLVLKWGSRNVGAGGGGPGDIRTPDPTRIRLR